MSFSGEYLIRIEDFYCCIYFKDYYISVITKLEWIICFISMMVMYLLAANV